MRLIRHEQHLERLVWCSRLSRLNWWVSNWYIICEISSLLGFCRSFECDATAQGKLCVANMAYCFAGLVPKSSTEAKQRRLDFGDVPSSMAWSPDEPRFIWDVTESEETPWNTYITELKFANIRRSWVFQFQLQVKYRTIDEWMESEVWRQTTSRLATWAKQLCNIRYKARVKRGTDRFGGMGMCNVRRCFWRWWLDEFSWADHVSWLSGQF